MSRYWAEQDAKQAEREIAALTRDLAAARAEVRKIGEKARRLEPFIDYVASPTGGDDDALANVRWIVATCDALLAAPAPLATGPIGSTEGP